MRAEGRTWSSPLLVLRAARNGLGTTRVGLVASKRVGKAVQRNRARRRLRAALRRLGPDLSEGWDLVIVVRVPMLEAPFERLESDLAELARRAGVYGGRSNGEPSSSAGGLA